MINIVMYTYGTGSGHLSRVNAVCKGFTRSNIFCNFYVIAPRSKYLVYLDKNAIFIEKDEIPKNIDIFICDWKGDDYIASLSKSFSKLWIGLRRLGTIKSSFPDYFHVIAIEPNVKGDICIWPIIATWSDELKSEEDLHKITNISEDDDIALVCENGSYASHVEKVLNKDYNFDINVRQVKCSNSPYSKKYSDLDYYPIARFFYATDYLIIGGGYNSIHEAICYANKERLVVVQVGGDDQHLRMKYYKKWINISPHDSQAHVLAQYIYELLKNIKKDK